MEVEPVSLINYPNPFNTITKIQWQSELSGHTTLEVLDIFGRKVETLVDEFKQSGEYTVKLDCKELNPGIYLLQLKVLNNIRTRKIVVRK